MPGSKNVFLNNIRYLLVILLILVSCSTPSETFDLKASDNDLFYADLPTRWDEGIPLGNGMLGALIWKKEDKLRISLDRADLWDLRPVAEFSRPEFKFSWVQEQVRKGDYAPVQRLFDLPFQRDPAPTKIPGGALEFNTEALGPIREVRLYLESAVCRIDWESGARMTVFIHATEPVGWYRFEGPHNELGLAVQPPPYGLEEKKTGQENEVSGQDLKRLNYPPPTVTADSNSIHYRQNGHGEFRFDIRVKWRSTGRERLDGVWSISADPCYGPGGSDAEKATNEALTRSWDSDLKTHSHWWTTYWEDSSLRVPDPLLQRQWYRETYKFGSASRRGAPPISLQAVWTADNGRIPPWKGDFHHDLNTQLSYWPCYSANHLEEGLAYLDWLWSIKETAKRFTRTYFGTNGLNVPGVTTLTGEPMGGWIQYSFSP
ncbi:glycoside hydrolase N-terminal domain-containing protein, partial [Acidobacteriota bacterium]